MKKRDRAIIFCLIFIIIILLAVIGFLLTKERKIYYPWPIGEESGLEIYSGDKRIIKIKEGTLTPTGATFILKNDEEYDVTYNKPYRLEMQIDKKWFAFGRFNQKFDISFYPLPSGEEREIDESWINRYDALPPGKYRYIIDISPTRSGATYVACEFAISKKMHKPQP